MRWRREGAYEEYGIGERGKREGCHDEGYGRSESYCEEGSTWTSGVIDSEDGMVESMGIPGFCINFFYIQLYILPGVLHKNLSEVLHPLHCPMNLLVWA